METKKNSLKPQDLVKIIEAGKRCCVAEISWHDLKITFTPKIEESTSNAGFSLKMDPNSLTGKESEDLNNLMISDPLAYEEALANGISAEEEDDN